MRVVLTLTVATALILALMLVTGCATLPEPTHKAYVFPKEEAFYGDVKRPYKTLGLVRAKVSYQTLDFTVKKMIYAKIISIREFTI